MFRRSSRTAPGFVGLIPLVALLIAGCGKPDQPPPAQPPSSKVVLATHWIGKERMARDTNAAYQMELWSLPESAHLEDQTLKKLARALPALLGVPSGGDANALADVIRPLLDDLVQAESFTEVRAAANQPAEFALAIRLSHERAALWETNIATVIQALADRSRPEPAASPKTLQFARAGDWTVLGIIWKDEFAASASPSASPSSVSAHGQNTLLAHFVQRFGSTNLPAGDTTNRWLELNADLSWLLRSNSIFSDQNLPSVQLTLAGEGHSVRTRAELTFPERIGIVLEPWQIPTNLIHDPLVSFTAIRGIKPAIESFSVWRNTQADAAPDQLYFWALERVPFQTYFAAVWPDSSNSFFKLSDQIMRRLNPPLSSNHWGQLSRSPETNANGIVWTGAPFFQPFLQHEAGSVDGLIVGGFTSLGRGRPLPSELLAQFVSQTNVLYYDWEITGGRNVGWLYLGQALRLAFGKAQFEPESAGLKWLQGVSPKLGNAVTVVHFVDSTHLTLSRISSAVLTCIELHGLVDWFESPEFPHGFHSLIASPPTGLDPKRKLPAPASGSQTNAAAVKSAGKP